MIFMRNFRVFLFPVFILLLLVATIAKGQDIPDRPIPPRLVNDFANILTPDEESALERKLVRFNDTTSNQITIVTIKSLNGYSPSMFATEIGLKWKVGQKKFDNGVVILVKPKLSSRDKGEVYIAVGYGLEPVIPDAIAVRIVNNEIIPLFKNNKFYQGLNESTSILMGLAAGEITAEGYNKKTAKPGIFAYLPFIVILIIIILIRGSRGRSQTLGHSSSSSLWTALMLGSMMGGRSNSGSWGNFTGGGSGFGGGGGGFGGFGGGSFGGGGAGGSW